MGPVTNLAGQRSCAWDSALRVQDSTVLVGVKNPSWEEEKSTKA